MVPLIHLHFWSWLLLALGLTHLTIISVTLYPHRGMSHRAVVFSPLLEHAFRFWLWLTTGMVTQQWMAVHRKHHATCETKDDPHSPRQLGLLTVLFGGAWVYHKAASDKATLAKYGHGAPDDWIESHLYTPYAWGGVLIMLGVELVLLGWAGVALWLVQMLWVPLFAAGVINGLGHWWGYRNFACADASTNLFPLGILIGGEELHNNHHAYGSSAKLSSKWFEFDIGWAYLQLLRFLKLATIRKVAPSLVLRPPREQVSADQVSALLDHRYAAYAEFGHAVLHAALRLAHAHAADFNDPQATRKKTQAAYRRWLNLTSAPATAEDIAVIRHLERLDPKVEWLHQQKDALQSLWARSLASTDNLALRLNDWLQQAEQSGLPELAACAGRLRQYRAF